MTEEQRKDMHALKMKIYAIHEEIRNKYLITNATWSTPLGPALDDGEKKQLWQVIQSLTVPRSVLNELAQSAEDRYWSGQADLQDRHNANWDKALNGPSEED